MRVVYEPENLIDAHLIKGLLEQSGIPVYLRGEHLAGGIGELPVIGLYALCVPDACEAEATGIMDALRSEWAAQAREEETDRTGDTGWVEVPA